MISCNKIQEYAKLRGYNLGQAEKDYFQEIILFVLYQEFGKELVFKGGTALTKCYGFDRFSEDLDFTVLTKKDYEKIISSGLKKFFLDSEIEKEDYKDSLKLTIRIQGPLYNGQRNSLCKIILDFSLREKVESEPKIIKIGLHVEEIPFFDVVVMSQEEILAEKIRTLITRNKARDLYDTYYLIKKGVKADHNLIDKKLNFYLMKYSFESLKEAVNKKEFIWLKELKHLVNNVPEFKEVKKTVISSAISILA